MGLLFCDCVLHCALSLLSAYALYLRIYIMPTTESKALKVIVVCLLLNTSLGFDLSELSDAQYCRNETAPHESCRSQISLYAGHTVQLKSVFSLLYNDVGLCNATRSNYTSALFGLDMSQDRQRISSSSANFRQSKQCYEVCSKTLSATTQDDVKMLETLKEAIDVQAEQYWFLDELPISWCYDTVSGYFCTNRIPMGCSVLESGQKEGACILEYRYLLPNTSYLLNHLDIKVYVKDGSSAEQMQIVMVRVEPHSVVHKRIADNALYCDTVDALAIPDQIVEDLTIHWTYSISFYVSSDFEWEIMWDKLFAANYATKLSIVHSTSLTIMAAFLVLAIFHGLRKHLQGDPPKSFKCWNCCPRLANYSASREAKRFLAIEEVADRILTLPRDFLCVALVGSGLQLICTSMLASLVCTFSSPEKFMLETGNQLLEQLCLVHIVCALPVGLASTLFYLYIQPGSNWFPQALLSTFASSAITLSFYFMQGASIDFQDSATVSLLWLACLLLGLCGPCLSLGGSLVGKIVSHKWLHFQANTEECEPQQPTIHHKCNQSIRSVTLHLLIAGILPSSALYIHLYFAMDALWSGAHLYCFFYDFFVLVLFLASTGSVSIILTMVRIGNCDYQWRQHCAQTAASICIYVFVYSVHFLLSKLEYADMTSVCYFLLYMFMVALALSLMALTVSYVCCWITVHFIHRLVLRSRVKKEKDEDLTMCTDDVHSDDAV